VGKEKPGIAVLDRDLICRSPSVFLFNPEDRRDGGMGVPVKELAHLYFFQSRNYRTGLVPKQLTITCARLIRLKSVFQFRKCPAGILVRLHRMPQRAASSLPYSLGILSDAEPHLLCRPCPNTTGPQWEDACRDRRFPRAA
jgi:hypothetical protein